MLGKGSITREVGKTFALGFAATFGSMAGLVVFGVVVEKCLERRPDEKTTPKIFQIDQRAAAMKRAGYSDPEIEETLLGKDDTLSGKGDTEDDTGVVTKD